MVCKIEESPVLSHPQVFVLAEGSFGGLHEASSGQEGTRPRRVRQAGSRQAAYGERPPRPKRLFPIVTCRPSCQLRRMSCWTVLGYTECRSGVGQWAQCAAGTRVACKLCKQGRGAVGSGFIVPPVCLHASAAVIGILKLVAHPAMLVHNSILLNNGGCYYYSCK